MNLTSAELANRWRCSTKTVQRIRKAGLLAHIEITRGHVLFPAVAVEEYEEKRTRKARRTL